MVSGATKKVVVLKDLPSNLIEEAILILKNGSSLEKCLENSGEEASKARKSDPDFILKEAELIINNFIKENNLHVKKPRRIRGRERILSNKYLVNVFINLSLAGSIALLGFILLKLF